MLVLQHSQAQIIRQLLIDLRLGTDPDDEDDWPIYATSEPDDPGTPDEVITVYNTVGVIDGRSMPTGEIFEHLGINIRIRSSRNTLASVKAYGIDNVLAETAYNNIVSLDGANYQVCSINRRGGVIDVGKEAPASERNVFSINAITAIIRTV